MTGQDRRVDVEPAFAFSGDRYAVVRGDGSFWTDDKSLADLRLVKDKQSVPLPDDYKAAFLREQPFDAVAAAAQK